MTVNRTPPLAEPADRTAMWMAALLRCPYCAALVLPDDMAAHGDAHRKHDEEHRTEVAEAVYEAMAGEDI